MQHSQEQVCFLRLNIRKVTSFRPRAFAVYTGPLTGWNMNPSWLLHSRAANTWVTQKNYSGALSKTKYHITQRTEIVKSPTISQYYKITSEKPTQSRSLQPFWPTCFSATTLSILGLAAQRAAAVEGLHIFVSATRWPLDQQIRQQHRHMLQDEKHGSLLVFLD